MTEPNEADRVLVFMDIAGAAPLWARDPHTMRTALDVFDDVVRARLAAFEGAHTRRMGSGTLAVWTSVVRAVRFCLSVQEGLIRAPWPTALLEQPEAAVVAGPTGVAVMAGLRCRMGVHMGPIWHASDGAIDGAAVRRAVRVARAAHGGQVLITQAVRSALDAATGGDITSRALGERPLRGVPGAVALYDVRSPGTGARRFPPPRTRDVERTNHQPERDAFVGRAADVSAVDELLGLGVRALTVCGPPGRGRCRLTSAVLDPFSGRWAGERGGGAWVVDGASVYDLDDFLSAVAHALDVDLSSQTSAQDAFHHLTRTLASRGSVLLVLRGLPAWPDDIRAVVTAWLQRVPLLQVLTTATQSIGLSNEVQYQLGPLDARGGDLRSAAARLFLRRVRERGAEVPVDQPEALARVLAAAAGSPLAIELLAGRAAVRSLSELASDLAGVGTDAHALYAVCLGHLSDWMRAALERLAVIEGPFTVGLAAEVSALDEWVAAPGPTDALALIQERGFIGHVRATDDVVVAEYVMHPALRRFLLDRVEPATLDSARDRYAHYAIDAAQPWIEEVNGAHGAEALAVLARYRRMLLAAFETGVRRAEATPSQVGLALNALLALDAVSTRQGLSDSHEARLDRAIALSQASGEHPRLLIRALRARARVRYLRSGLSGARDDLERARELGRSTNDREGEGMALGALGQILASRGRASQAIETLTEALTLLVTVDAPRETAAVRAALGSVLTGLGDPRGAETHLAAAVLGFHAGGDERSEALARMRLATARRRLGKLDAAWADLERALAVHVASGNRRREAEACEQLGAVYAQRAQLDLACTMLERGRTLARAVGDRRTLGRLSCRLGMVLDERGDPLAAREAFNEALALAADTQSVSVTGLAHAGLGTLLHGAGKPVRALTHYSDSVERFEVWGEPRVASAALALHASCQAEVGHTDEARKTLHTLLSRMAEAGDTWVDKVGMLCRAWVEAESTNWSEPTTATLRDILEGLRGIDDVPIVVRTVYRIAGKRLQRATFQG